MLTVQVPIDWFCVDKLEKALVGVHTWVEPGEVQHESHDGETDAKNPSAENDVHGKVETGAFAKCIHLKKSRYDF